MLINLIKNLFTGRKENHSDKHRDAIWDQEPPRYTSPSGIYSSLPNNFDEEYSTLLETENWIRNDLMFEQDPVKVNRLGEALNSVLYEIEKYDRSKNVSN